MQSSRFAGLLARFASGAGMMAIGLSILAASPASAVDERCRSVKSDKDRLACFDRGAASTQGGKTDVQPAADKKAFIDPVDLLKTENDKVSARLKGVCRRC